MGCKPNTAPKPPSNLASIHINKFIQISNINHPLNINKKYQHLTKIDSTKQVGHGFKKVFTSITQTSAYYSLITKEELEIKRKQFWETRVNGNPQVWRIIRQAISKPNTNQTLSTFSYNKISMLNGTVQMCLDEGLNKYQVPVFCINDPISYAQGSQQDRNLNIEYEDKKLQITIRSTRFPNGDLLMEELASTHIQIIKSLIKALKNLPGEIIIRLFYNGREMKDQKTLGNYSYEPGTVILAMIS